MSAHIQRTHTKDIDWLLHEKYNGVATDMFYRDIVRIESGEPIDYIIGFTPFLSCTIDLSYRPMIPRQETEHWVEQLIGDTPKEKPVKCLDIFSGSGCIGIALLKHLPRSIVHFGELKKDLVKQIKKNILINKVEKKRTAIFLGDCFSNIPITRYDIITANPPYIPFDKKTNISRSVLDWEPHEALFAPEHGFYYITRLLKEGYAYLKKGGSIYIEFDEPQHNALEELAVKSQQYETSFFKDQFGKWRYVKLTSI